jgi:hypothetical protein
MRRFIAALFACALMAAPAMATPPNFNGNLTAQGKPWYDIQSYGAKCDGTTDDSTAIQNANTAASAAKGTLYFPSGLNCYYNSSSPIVIGANESVYGVGATITGGASTTDAFQIYGGATCCTFHNATTISLPSISGFQKAAIHLEPNVQQANIIFQSIQCTGNSSSATGIGIEIESNHSGGAEFDGSVGDSQIQGTGVSLCHAGVEIVQATSNDSIQGILLNLLWDHNNYYDTYFHTTSGTVINPTLTTFNEYNITATDCGSFPPAGSAVVYVDANFTIPFGNAINAHQFIGDCSTYFSNNGAGILEANMASVQGQAAGSELIPFIVPQVTVLGVSDSGLSPVATPPPSNLTGGIGGLGVSFSYAGGKDVDLYNTYVPATPTGGSFRFYQSTTGAPTLLGKIDSTGWTGGVNASAAIRVNCNGSACLPASENSSSMLWNYSNGAGESDWVDTFNSTNTTNDAHRWYTYQSGVFTMLARLNRSGDFFATGKVSAGGAAGSAGSVSGADNTCSSTSGLPCRVSGVPGCTMSASTSCSVTATVPSGSACTVTYDHATAVPVTALLPPEVGVSGTTLTMYASASSSQSATVGFDAICE